MTHERRFDPTKFAKLDAAERRERMPWAAIRAAADLPAHGRLADVGAGTGYYTFALLDGPVAPGLVHAIDPSASMREELSRRAHATGKGDVVKTHLAPAESLPIADRSVDGVIFGNVFHELDDPSRALAEARRVLAPGGRVLVVDWERPDAASGEPEIGPPFAHRVAQGDVEAALLSAGLVRVRAHPGFRDVYALTASAPA